PGASMVAVSQLQVKNVQVINYTVSILAWDAIYALQPASVHRYSDRQESSGSYPTSWIPAIVSNRILAVSAHVLRFNGQAWLDNSSLYVANPAAQTDQRYAYGPDYALQILVDGRGVAAPVAKVLGFDPNTDSAGWSTAAATPAQALSTPPAFAATANW